jgi:hypothetical protein
VDSSVSFGLKGGHPEDHGVLPSGAIITVPEHFHEVELDIYRYEIGLSKTVGPNLDFTLRFPYFIKDQKASTQLNPTATAMENAASIRNGFIHHRTETYEGFGDPEVMIGWRRQGLFGPQSVMRLAVGFTIPVGSTEEDPWVLGGNGEEHLHILFGNGTFDPLVELYLGKPITKQWAWSVSGKARLPFYHNSKGYRGFNEFSLAPRVTYLANKDLSFSAGLVAQYLGYSDWEKTGRDENSGQFSLLGSVGAGYKLNSATTLSLSVLIPIHSRTFSDEDVLDPTPTVSFSLGYSF